VVKLPALPKRNHSLRGKGFFASPIPLLQQTGDIKNMLGTSAISGISNNRIFVYEVTGLKQTDENDLNNYSFRTSSSVLIQVPYSRMNQEMQRINRMGGKIVSIRPLSAASDE
jgi:phycocyanin-associated rod protein